MNPTTTPQPNRSRPRWKRLARVGAAVGEGPHDVGEGPHDVGEGPHDVGEGPHAVGEGPHAVDVGPAHARPTKAATGPTRCGYWYRSAARSAVARMRRPRSVGSAVSAARRAGFLARLQYAMRRSSATAKAWLASSGTVAAGSVGRGSRMWCAATATARLDRSCTSIKVASLLTSDRCASVVLGARGRLRSQEPVTWATQEERDGRSEETAGGSRGERSLLRGGAG